VVAGGGGFYVSSCLGVGRLPWPPAIEEGAGVAAARQWRWVVRRREQRRGSATGQPGLDNQWAVACGGGGGTALRRRGGGLG